MIVYTECYALAIAAQWIAQNVCMYYCVCDAPLATPLQNNEVLHLPNETLCRCGVTNRLVSVTVA